MTLNIGVPILCFMDIQKRLSGLVDAGLTQVEIGRKLKRRQSTISEMLSGKSGCKRPSADVERGIAELERMIKKRNKPM